MAIVSRLPLFRRAGSTGLTIVWLLGASTLATGGAAHAQCGIPPTFKNEIGEPARPAESVPHQSVLPSTLVHYVHLQYYLQPEWDQQQIAWPLLDLARTENLDDEERFFWAQLNYMSFKAVEAYDLFGEFAHRDDWYGAVARERRVNMDTRAFQDFERLQANVEEAAKKFDPKPEFAAFSGWGELSLCIQLGNRGEHERAADFTVQTVNGTPRDAAYGAFYMLERCFVSFEETGREQEALSLAAAVREDLKRSLAQRESQAGEHAAYDPRHYENVIEDAWYGRSTTAPYNYQSYKMKEMVGRFDALLACKRDGAEDACAGVTNTLSRRL